MQQAARRLGTVLTTLEAAGTRAEWEGDPVLVQLPAATGQPVRTGRFVWDLADGAVTADEELFAILTPRPRRFPAPSTHWWPCSRRRTPAGC
ncbi:hypothetical protein NKH18_04180 [Streptomyces sp. M10(2022)]